MNPMIAYQWELFISIEILSVIMLFLFGFTRYFLNKHRLSSIFIMLFLGLIVLESLLAFIIYRVTGEISSFQIIIAVFVLYACTFGIADFKKLDRWMRLKIGKWRDIDLLTEKDYEIIAKNNDPKYIAKKYRFSSTIHLIVFIIGQAILWISGTESLKELYGYLADLSWFQEGSYENSPYANETMYSIGLLWIIIFFVDFVWSWSYTFFPSKQKK